MLQEVSLGLLYGVEYILWMYSFASIVFIGVLAEFLPVGVVVVLVGSGLVGVIVALTSSVPINCAATDAQPAAILASVAIIMNERIAEFAAPAAAAATLLVIMAMVTIGFSVCLRLIVSLKVDILLQLVPFPVVCGFLGGLGWLLLDAGFNITTGFGVYDLPALLGQGPLENWIPSFLCGLSIYLMVHFRRHILTLPVSHLLCFVGFYAVAYLSGTSLETMRAEGLLFRLDHSGSVKGFDDLDFAGVNFEFILSVLPEMATIILFVLLSAAFNLSGLEVGMRTTIPLRDELRRLGNANVASGLVMGLPGVTDIDADLTVHKVGVRSRVFPLLTSAICIAATLLGSGIIEYIPKFLIATMIFYSAVQFTHEWLFAASRTMPRDEALVVWLIFGVIAAVGFIPGVVLGILVSSLMFVIRYSNIDVVASSFPLNSIGSSVERSQPERRTLSLRGQEVNVFNLRGFLFFGSASLFFEKLKKTTDEGGKLSYVIFNFSRVTGIDSTAVQVFLKIVDYLKAAGIKPIMCGMNPMVRIAFSRSLGFEASNTLILEELDLALKWTEEALLAEEARGAETPDIQDILVGIFQDRDKATRLAGVMTRCAFDAGAHLFRQGDEGTGFYIIESGVVEVRLEPPNGPVIRLREFRSGTTFGEMAAYSDSKSRSASAVAIAPTVAYHLSPETIDSLGDAAAEYRSIVHEFVARLLASRLAFMNKRFEFSV